MEFHVHLNKRWDRGDGVDIYVWRRSESRSDSVVMKDGLLQLNPKEEGEEGDVFLTLIGTIAHPFLTALTEGLAKIGYVAEVDNAKRITSEALAQEREKELNYFKELNRDLIFKKFKED